MPPDPDGAGTAAATASSARPDQGPDDAATVARTAAALVAAFGRHDTAAYFQHFAPEATFVFYTVDHVLTSRAAYQSLWSTWEQQDGFRVRSCSSSNVAVTVLGDIAVVTHDVSTTVSGRGGTTDLSERESIVFQRQGTRWLAVHEHLSPRSVLPP